VTGNKNKRAIGRPVAASMLLCTHRGSRFTIHGLSTKKNSSKASTANTESSMGNATVSRKGRSKMLLGFIFKNKELQKYSLLHSLWVIKVAEVRNKSKAVKPELHCLSY